MSESVEFFSKEFDALVEDALSFYHCPGMSVGILHKGKTYTKGYGYSNLESKTPVTPKTLFSTGSSTKSFVAAAFSLLAEDNARHPNVDFSTPISTVLPEDFVLSDSWATEHITFEDALCHRSGYPRYDLAYGKPNANLSDVVRVFRHLPMTAPPRTEWQYSNAMYITVSHAIETLTGSWLGDFLRKRIWSPLGMKSTFFSPPDARAYAKASDDPDDAMATPYMWISADKDNVTPYATVSEKDHYVKETWVAPPIVSGGGAIISTVIDFLKYLDCMLQEKDPISKTGHAELRKPRLPIAEAFYKTVSDQPQPTIGATLYSLGWVLDVYARAGSQAVQIWHHAGGLPGFGAEMRYIPALDLCITTMGNSSPGGNFAGNAVCWRIIDDVLGVPHESRFDWKKELLHREQVGAKELSGKRESLFEGLDVPEKAEGEGEIEEYQGVYENDAYQSLAVSVVQQPDKDRTEKSLHITPSARAFTDIFELHHVVGDWFLAEQYYTYPDGAKHIEAGAGPGKLAARVRAVFRRDAEGKVSGVGIEIEDALVAKAAKEAKKRAGSQEEDGKEEKPKKVFDAEGIRKGMIWFDKVEKEMFTVER